MPSNPFKSSNSQHEPKPRPDPSFTWGITARLREEDSENQKPPEDSYSPEEQAERRRQRANGVNPDLKAEMDRAVYGKGSEGEKQGGLWKRFKGTLVGGTGAAIR